MLQIERRRGPRHTGGRRYQHDHSKISSLLAYSGSYPGSRDLEHVLQRATSLEPLSLEDVVTLIRTKNSQEQARAVLSAANLVRRRLFGNDVKFYVPVYITSVCVNNCVYCGYRKDNTTTGGRIVLNLDALEQEVEYLIELGHRHIELVLGYHPKITNGSALGEYASRVRQLLTERGGGTIILMSEPMGQNDYELASAGGVSEVYCWVETYHPDTYRNMHPQGTHKADPLWRYQVFERVLDAGISRIGMGTLAGLYDWAYDELSLASNALWLRERYGIDPYAFGIPRFKPGNGIPLQRTVHDVNNDLYKLSVAIKRLVFPRTHTYMNSREDLSLMTELLNCGGTEINAEASTVPGGYTRPTNGTGEQFFHHAFQSGVVFRHLKDRGFVPTFAEVSPRE